MDPAESYSSHSFKRPLRPRRPYHSEDFSVEDLGEPPWRKSQLPSRRDEESSSQPQGRASKHRMRKIYHTPALPDLNKYFRPEEPKAMLYFAILKGKISNVERCLPADGNLNFHFDDGQTPLSLAARLGDLELVQCLRGKGADVYQPGQGPCGNALVEASLGGHCKVVRYFLITGTDSNRDVQRDDLGSALVAAAMSGDVTTIELLIFYGAPVNMEIACECEFGTIAREFEFGTVIMDSMSVHLALGQESLGLCGTSLMAATYFGNLDALNVLLEAGADVNMRLEHGLLGSAFMAALFCRDKEVMDLLLDWGADVNQQLLTGIYGDAISFEIHDVHGEFLDLLLDAGATLGPLAGKYLKRKAIQDPELRRFSKQVGGWCEGYFKEIGEDIATVQSYYPAESSLAEAIDLRKVELTYSGAFIRKDDTVEFVILQEFLQEKYGTPGVDLLTAVVQLLRNPIKAPTKRFINKDMLIEAKPGSVLFETSKSRSYLLEALEWIYLTVRMGFQGQPRHSIPVFPASFGDFRLSPLQHLAANHKDNLCWQKLFGSILIASRDPRSWKPSRGLEIDFNLMVRLAAVEYPVLVNSGLVLMGYSTALVPIQETEDDMIIWHLEIAENENQLKISDLEATKEEKWLMTQDFEYLQSKKAILGWCSKAQNLLGTDGLSDAKTKPITWEWKGANIQALAQSAAPVQIGGQVGLSFERTPNVIQFTPSRNYIKCLQNSTKEQIVLYDVSTQRAWLVPLICVLHHMLLVYCNNTVNLQDCSVPKATPSTEGSNASLLALKDSGGTVIQGSGQDALTVRDLVMGFSINLSRVSPHKPSGSKIYGYEFMDIVMDSPRSELKKRSLDRKSQKWSHMLDDLNCLFCSGLGEAIIGERALQPASPCNSLPVGKDLLAASVQSLIDLSAKYGGPTQVSRVSKDHRWQMTGSPFRGCQHDSEKSCWNNPDFLQEIGTHISTEVPNGQKLEEHISGALVFGERVEPKLPWMPIKLPWIPIKLSWMHIKLLGLSRPSSLKIYRMVESESLESDSNHTLVR